MSAGGAESTRNVALTGVPALPEASRLAAYTVCGPGVAIGAPPPANGQPGGRSANVAGGTAGSSTQRVSVTSPEPSAADTAIVTGDTYQPPLPFGAAGVGETVVTGGVVSVNTEQVNARGVTMMDHALSVPESKRKLSATRTVQSPLVLRPFRRDSCPTGSSGLPTPTLKDGELNAGFQLPVNGAALGATLIRSPVAASSITVLTKLSPVPPSLKTPGSQIEIDAVTSSAPRSSRLRSPVKPCWRLSTRKSRSAISRSSATDSVLETPVGVLSGMPSPGLCVLVNVTGAAVPDANPTRLVTLVDVVPSALVTWKRQGDRLPAREGGTGPDEERVARRRAAGRNRRIHGRPVDDRDPGRGAGAG